MSNKVRFIIDSSVDVAPRLQDRFTVLPLPIRFGEEEYLDGVTISKEEFYRKLTEGDVTPATSQATPYTYAKYFREAVNNDEDVLCLTLSSKLSGTWQNAVLAAEEFPDRVFVVDGRNVTITSAVLAQYGLQLLDDGKSAAETAEILTRARDNIHLVAIVNTMEYLCRGGRVSRTAAVAGELLAIKPLIGMKGGEPVVLGKARGAKNAVKMFIKEVEKAGGIDFSKPVLLGYTGQDDHMLSKLVQDCDELWEGRADQLDRAQVGSTIGTHAGPDAVAVAFFNK